LIDEVSNVLWVSKHTLSTHSAAVEGVTTMLDVQNRDMVIASSLYNCLTNG
jgi:hypothetical protein